MITTEYITRPGDRWDLISYRAYGTVEKMGDIILANPEVVVDEVIPEGTLLQIPIVPAVEVKMDAELLPPWKRG